MPNVVRGTTVSSGGGGGTADSSAANQTLEIAAINKLNAQLADYDTGAGVASQVLVGLSLPASGGPVGVSLTNPLPVSARTLVPGAPTAASVGVTDALAFAASASRTRMELLNTSPNFVSIAFGANTAVLYSGLTLTPYGYYNIDNPSLAALAIRAVASDVTSNLGMQPYT